MAFVLSPISHDNGFRQIDYWTWCPSIIHAPDTSREGQGRMRWHMFASRWPKWLPFHPGWMVASEVVRAVADRAEGPYRFAEVVLPARGAEYWDGRCTHNPSIRYHNNKYWLFYTGSTHPFADILPTNAGLLDTDQSACIVARERKRIGLAWADSVNGPWQRSNTPILDTKPQSFYSFLTSNPAPWIHDNGYVTMLFKSREWLAGQYGPTHGPMSIGIAEADSPAGPYRVISGEHEPLFGKNSPEWLGELEDPFLWQDADSGRFRMVAKDMTGNLCGHLYGGVLAETEHVFPIGAGGGARMAGWRLSGPSLAYRRELTYTNGALCVVGNLERPFLYFEKDHEGRPRPVYLCAAVSNGKTGFCDAKDSWNVVLPLSDLGLGKRS